MNAEKYLSFIGEINQLASKYNMKITSIDSTLGFHTSIDIRMICGTDGAPEYDKKEADNERDKMD